MTKRVCFIGEARVGKTSIIQRQLKKSIEGIFPTVGIDANRITVNNQTFDVVDTAGQETYHGITQSSIRSCQIAVIVFDLGNKNSFTQIEEYWLEFIESVNFPSCIIIVGNKKDLDKKYITYQEGISLTKRIIDKYYKNEDPKIQCCVYFETSAEKNDGIEDLFTFIAKKFQEIDTLPSNVLIIEDEEKKKEKTNDCSC